MSEYELICVQQANRDFWLQVIIAIITFISVLFVYLDYRNRKSKEQAEKSINIAETFAKQVIDKLSVIHLFFEQSGLMDITEKSNFLYFSDFDVEELHQLYTQEDIDTYTNKMISLKLEDIKDMDSGIILQEIICNTLNELEYLCMYITTKVADEKYIYNSLHQQFLKVISLLYINISLSNTDSKDKYYTNIIHVFNIWKNKYYKAVKKENKIKKMETVANNFFKKLKKPKNPKIK